MINLVYQHLFIAFDVYITFAVATSTHHHTEGLITNRLFIYIFFFRTLKSLRTVTGFALLGVNGKECQGYEILKKKQLSDEVEGSSCFISKYIHLHQTYQTLLKTRGHVQCDN